MTSFRRTSRPQVRAPQNTMPTSLTSGWGVGSIGTALGAGNSPFDQLVRGLTGGTNDLFMSTPEARRAVAFDQRNLQGLMDYQRPMVTQTYDVEPETAQLLRSRGIDVQGQPTAPVRAPSGRQNDAAMDALIRKRFRSQLYQNPGTDLLTQLFGSYLNLA